MRWVTTDFGRYALCPTQLLAAWGGEEADVAIVDDAGRIGFEGRDVITLAGEPLDVAWIPERLSFVRWISADGDGELAASLDAAIEDPSRWECSAEVELGGSYRLIDSAYPGDYPHAGERIEVEIPPGVYQLLSLSLETPSGDEFRVDRLEPVPAAA